ncbi:tetratricopeptide repeat protein [Halarsenatibacter silvermanii]|nr:hypothetical protein [Halarsenatibacter silvermanii]
MKNLKKISIFLPVLIMAFMVFAIPGLAESGEEISRDELSSQEFWELHREEAQEAIAENGSLKDNYRLAVSQANLGYVRETMEMIDEFADDFDVDKLEEEIDKELHLARMGSENILYMNYAAFYYSIIREPEEAAGYFARIIERDEGNVWPYNYKATLYIEELEDMDRAHEILKQALEIEDNDYTHLLRAYAYYESGSYIRALNSLRRGRAAMDDLEDIM